MVHERTRSSMLIAILIIAGSLSMYIDADGAGADPSSVTLIIEIPEPENTQISDFAEITVNGWGSTMTPDGFDLPARTFYIPVDPDDIPTVSGYFLCGSNRLDLDRRIISTPMPSVNGEIGDVPDIEELSPVTDLGTIEVEGSFFRMIRISPYSICNDDITYPDQIEVYLELRNPPSASSAKVPADLPDPTVEGAGNQNPPWVAAPMSAPAPEAGSVYHNTVPDTECLIITSSSLNNSLQPLASWKTGRGVYTRVVETSWIYNNFNGNDNQAKIRACIKSFYSNENLQWVILGGDNSVVPTRMAYIPDGYGDSGSDGSTVPADGYYGDLSGTGHSPYDWDGDNDGNYGEYSVDGIDLSMEVYVGRLSATSSSAMTSLVDNILDYEKNPPSGSWFNRTVLAGAYSNYVSSTQSATDEAKLKEEIRKDFLDGGNYVNYTLYEGSGVAPSSYPKNASLTTSNLISAINSGAAIVNLAGHGSNTGIYRRIWSSDSNSNGYCDSGEYYDTSYYSTSASQTNGGKKPLFYNDACNNGNFDSTWCLTEDIVRDVGIGAVGAGRVSWYAVGWSPGSDGGYYNQGHDYRFWEQWAGGAYQPGKALALSHSDYISDKTAHNAQVWKNLVQYNLIGDPEIPIYNSTPLQFTVNYSDPIPSPGTQTFVVKDPSGNGVKDAMVCLSNGTTFYAASRTDSNGRATINMPTLTMMANLTVTARNFKPFIKTVAIGSDDDPPEFGMTSFSGNTTTGDGFTIGQIVTDNVEVANVSVRYAWNQSQPVSWNNASMMNKGTYWEFNSTHPTNSTDPLWFSIGASDRAGNWNHTSWTRKTVTDNDLPLFLDDGTSSSVTTGDPLLFNCTVDDNLMVSSCSVNFSIDGGPWYEIMMCGTGYSRQIMIMIPSDTIGTLSYKYNITDGAGNRNVTGPFFRTIRDDDSPVFHLDRTILPPRTGNATIFDIRVTDNIQVARAKLIYMETGGNQLNLTMTTTDNENFTRSVDIPSDRLVNISYHFFVEDTSGNVFHSDNSMTGIIDDDLPQAGVINHDRFMTTGDEFGIVLTTSDNIGVQSVMARFNYSDGLELDESFVFNETMDTWDLSLLQPSNIAGFVNFTISITDTSGNKLVLDPVPIELRDNDLPEMIADQSDPDGISGGEFRFETRVEDNIGIEEVRLFAPVLFPGYRILSPSSRASVFSLITDIPMDIMGEIEYHFEIEDHSSNVLITDIFNTSIEDRTYPEAIFLGFLQSADSESDYATVLTTGESFTAVAWIKENIALDLKEMHFRIGGGMLVVRNLTLDDENHGNDNHTCTIRMPLNTTGMVTFRMKLIDTSGNMKLTEWSSMDLVDNDDPTVLKYSGGYHANTSGSMEFEFSVEDNIGVVSHSVRLIGYPEALIESSLVNGLVTGTLTLDETFNDPEAVLVLNISDGNMTDEMRVSLNINDGTPPNVIFEVVPEEMLLSGSYQMKCTINDNVGWTSPLIEWKEKTGEPSDPVPIEFEKTGENGIAGDLIPPGPGEWTIHFEVEDSAGNIFIRDFQVTVEDDIDPVPEIDLEDVDFTIGDTITVEGSSSEDESEMVTYTWIVTLPDGSELTFEGKDLDYTPEMEGDYNITLEVEDSYGNKGVSSTTITVTPIPDEEEDGTDDDTLLYALLIGSVLLFIIVLITIFLIVRRKRSSGDEEDEWETDEEDEEVMSWD